MEVEDALTCMFTNVGDKAIALFQAQIMRYFACCSKDVAKQRFIFWR
jgi:hypothetical protein